MKTIAILAVLCLAASLPAWAEAPKPADTGCVIFLKGNGDIVVHDSVVSKEQLATILSGLAAADPGQRVVIRGEDSTVYKQVREVLDICAAAKLTNVGFSERSK